MCAQDIAYVGGRKGSNLHIETDVKNIIVYHYHHQRSLAARHRPEHRRQVFRLGAKRRHGVRGTPRGRKLRSCERAGADGCVMAAGRYLIIIVYHYLGI